MSGIPTAFLMATTDQGSKKSIDLTALSSWRKQSLQKYSDEECVSSNRIKARGDHRHGGEKR